MYKFQLCTHTPFCYGHMSFSTVTWHWWRQCVICGAKITHPIKSLGDVWVSIIHSHFFKAFKLEFKNDWCHVAIYGHLSNWTLQSLLDVFIRVFKSNSQCSYQLRRKIYSYKHVLVAKFNYFSKHVHNYCQSCYFGKSAVQSGVWPRYT